MSKRAVSCWAAAFILFWIGLISAAAADSFSYNCTHSGSWNSFTFDDVTKRVIGFGPWKTQAIFTGTITAITPEEIHFDLVLPFDKIRLGNFTLNRKESWMTSLGSPGRTDLKDTCKLGPPRPVLDLWRLIDQRS